MPYIKIIVIFNNQELVILFGSDIIRFINLLKISCIKVKIVVNNYRKVFKQIIGLSYYSIVEYYNLFDDRSAVD